MANKSQKVYLYYYMFSDWILNLKLLLICCLLVISNSRSQVRGTMMTQNYYKQASLSNVNFTMSSLNTQKYNFEKDCKKKSLYFILSLTSFLPSTGTTYTIHTLHKIIQYIKSNLPGYLDTTSLQALILTILKNHR